MSNRKINEAKLIELVPPNIQNDPDIKAAASAIDTGFFELVDYLPRLKVLAAVDDLPEEMLDHLIWQFGVNDAEAGWLADTIEEKRDLVKNALYIKMKKGTKFALKRVLEILNMRGQVQEWFEYSGDPYYFKIEIDVKNKSLSESRINLLEKLVDVHKNKRSHLEVITFQLSSEGIFYTPATTQCGESIEVKPWQARELEGQVTANYGAIIQATDLTVVYPQ